MKKILIVSALGALICGGFLFRYEIQEAYQKGAAWFASSDDPSIAQIKQDFERISMPAPLRNDSDAEGGTLTRAGVIAETNRHRTAGSVSAVKENQTLDKAAEIKLNDMFERQYFAHESPIGEGPAEVAAKAGYAYVVIGENLALGNFSGDVELVQGWMDSPGHRENIMNVGYLEIGVAVGRGMYEGKLTWLAVQEFGTPASACSAPDTGLEAAIRDKKSAISALEPKIEAKKREIDSYEPKRGEGYNAAVREYNALISRYNASVAETKGLVSQFNLQVEGYNACLKRYSHD